MCLNQNSVLRLTILACLLAASNVASSLAIAACTDPSTCFGTGALEQDISVEGNTAFGFHALRDNTEGGENVAVGVQALEENVLGDINTAVGHWALKGNQNAGGNTAVGAYALPGWSVGGTNTFRQLGGGNSAFGASALLNNETGDGNTAVGFAAMLGKHDLMQGISGNNNVAIGASSLVELSSGSSNTATGVLSLNLNSTGSRNTATGVSALSNLTTGNRNTAIGAAAGKALVSGSNNIIIGGQNFGVAAENGVIRIGTKTFQKKAFIAGIRGVQTALQAASAVFIDANGQLGTIRSSRRFKEDIRPMANVSERLFALRPVTFHYKESDEDGSNPVQYGLIAEEVAVAFPELVINGQDGKPESVSYHLLATLLLNEVQKERQVTHQQASELERQSAELAHLKQNVAKMADVIARLEHAQTLGATQ